MGKEEKHKKQSHLVHSIPEEKDSFRWVVIVLFLVMLFVSYIFWMQGI